MLSSNINSHITENEDRNKDIVKKNDTSNNTVEFLNNINNSALLNIITGLQKMMNNKMNGSSNDDYKIGDFLKVNDLIKKMSTETSNSGDGMNVVMSIEIFDEIMNVIKMSSLTIDSLFHIIGKESPSTFKTIKNDIEFNKHHNVVDIIGYIASDNDVFEDDEEP